jgi:cellulose synthase/poly-beta-1,6-N-acetylglucosamine synthase-like glycosyltransferase
MAGNGSGASAMAPTIDVVIPARNEGRYLRECLDALAAQNYPLTAVSVFVVDNGSTDDTVAIAEGYPHQALRVRLLRQTRRGAAAARNLAIEHGTGDLLALLDAHCIADPSWLNALAARFANPQLGGCQARTVSRATSPRVQRYLESSGEQSNERILDDTVLGRRNLYPWVLSGNSMYRREAVEAAGGFDEQLRACEDVDLGWRVVLLGYQLGYEPDAIAVHYDANTWWSFVRKGLVYGAGAAELTRRYEPHGAKNKFSPASVWSRSIDRSLSSLSYGLGYQLKDIRMSVGLDTPPSRQPTPPVTRFRSWFRWDAGHRMRVGDRTIFWLRDVGAPESVVVHVPTRVRLVLDGAGDRIWRDVVAARSRDDIATGLSSHYGISRATADADLDDFVEELVAGEFVERAGA